MSGIIRRIDELGRIVIPKEIRKVLDLKEGSCVNIQSNNEGILLSKYMPLKRLNNYIHNLALVLSDNLKISVVITDDKKVIDSQGVGQEFNHKPLSDYFLSKFNVLKTYYNSEVFNIVQEQNSSFCGLSIIPIKDNLVTIGSIVLVEKVSNKQISDNAVFVAKTMASYISSLI